MLNQFSWLEVYFSEPKKISLLDDKARVQNNLIIYSYFLLRARCYETPVCCQELLHVRSISSLFSIASPRFHNFIISFSLVPENCNNCSFMT